MLLYAPLLKFRIIGYQSKATAEYLENRLNRSFQNNLWQNLNYWQKCTSENLKTHISLNNSIRNIFVNTKVYHISSKSN